jgi:hypothetical protein
MQNDEHPQRAVCERKAPVSACYQSVAAHAIQD